MTRFSKRLVMGLAAALAALVLVLALGLATVWLKPDLVKPLLLQGLSAAGVKAQFGRLELGLNPLSLIIDQAELELKDKTRLDLDHLSVKISLVDLIWGGPWIEQVDARGLSMETAPTGPEESPSFDISPMGWVFLAKRADLSDAAVSFPFHAGRLKITDMKLSLTPAGEKARHVHLTLKAAFNDAKGRSLASGEFVTQGLMDPGPSLKGRMEIKQAEFSPTGRPIPLSAQADFELDRKGLNLSIVNFGADETASARGKFQMNFKGGMSGRLQGRIIDMAKALALAKDELPEQFAGLNIQGELPFSLDFTKPKDRVRLDLSVTTDEIWIAWQGLNARLEGDVKLAGGPQDPWQLAGTVKAQGRFISESFKVSEFNAEIPLSGALESPRCQGLELSFPADALSFQGRALALGKVLVSADAAVNNGDPSADKIKLELAEIGEIGGNARLSKGFPQGRLHGKGLKFAGLAKLLRSAGPALADLEGQGPVDINIQIKPETKAPRLLARMDIKELSISADAGQIMAQKLAGRLEGNALLTSRPELEVDISLPKGEALWGTIFLNFSQNPMALRARAALAGPGLWRGIDVTGRLGSFGGLTAKGELLTARGDLAFKGDLGITDASLGPIFATFVQDPLSASRPDLASLSPSGRARLNLNINRTAAKTLMRGALKLTGGGLTQDKKTVLKGLDLNLPIAYIMGGPGPQNSPAPAPGQWGRLTLKRLSLGGMDLGPFDLPITLLPNRLYLGQALDIPLWGGRVHLSDIKVDDPLSPLFKAVFKARISGLDLGLAPTGAIKLKGNLKGRLDPVVLSPRSLKTKGELKGGMFGGSLNITNIGMERPFTPGREIGADLDMKKMDLSQLSTALDIGNITGAVDISLKGLRLAYGQPVGFDLSVESVKEPGRDQKVSLKAVNSISILGTGSGLSGMGVGLLKHFFQEFPYEKIGFRCALNNDVFRIKGLIKEGEEEYIVKKPLLTGINVINRSGDNQISFSDMLKRLKRVTSK